MNKIILILFSLFILSSCNDDEIDYGKIIDEPYQLDIPSYFPKMTFDTEKYPLTKNGVELGRKLFYEGRLSRNNTISCAFCHIQENAFTHHGHTVSHGIEDRIGIRNAPPIQNLAFLNRYMWDGVIHDLAQQPISPITAEEEMDTTFPEIIKKLSGDSNYRKMFKNAFGDESISANRILSALGQFMASVVSKDAKYDQYVRKEADLTTLEKTGMQLFQQKCSSCHQGALFTDESFRNTGMYYDKQYKDGGLYRVTLDSADFMKFRVPSLRNIEMTKPYMHDGRFYSLEAVLNFYSDNVQNDKRLDPLLKQNGQRGIPMTDQEKKAIIAFLKTLTDYTFIHNPAYAEF
ncbi:c-type cytochrome [Empedobacter brevis]|uniref:C-type cytochrome n=1 Tax=Empedobacter brevis TaxID=247 RepID=A0AAJ1V9K8_9FLAO|nr:cytochrome c peroxidase [Empedobacter brevis]MDM1074227.1 c-type cytochrome [Empedobacter brevis]